MSYRRRTFPEVLDNLLTALTDGVAAEVYPFPPEEGAGPPFRYSLLQPPVAEIVSLYGSRDGQPFLFVKGGAEVPGDYRLEEDGQTLAWTEGGRLPDPGTVFHVNYYPAARQPVVTDLYTGSVVRTLSETLALEMARLYAQLEAVYHAGFVDTATGRALENVVALLGLQRVEGGRPAGEVVFTRVSGSQGSISIPMGTRIITPDGNVEYETTASVTMAQGQRELRVVARDLEQNEPLPADALTVLPIPIAGIRSVTNPAPTTITTRDETDAELRARAKNFLHGSERATLGALQEAVARQGLSAEVIEDLSTPGYIEVRPIAETLPPELEARLRAAIEDVRPAGVEVRLLTPQPPSKINLAMRLTTISGLLEQDLRAAQRAVRAGVEDYFARLPMKAPGSINKLVGIALDVEGVEDVRLLSATRADTDASVLDLASGELTIGGLATVLGALDITDPNLATQLHVVVAFEETEAPPDETAIEAALETALAYLNGANAADTVAADVQALSFGKLLHVAPIPGKPGASLSDFDAAVASGTPPALPDESTIAPYAVQFVFTAEGAESVVLEQSGDGPYVLAPFERLTLSGVDIVEVAHA